MGRPTDLDNGMGKGLMCFQNVRFRDVYTCFLSSFFVFLFFFLLSEDGPI